jgi:hypothetical protein
MYEKITVHVAGKVQQLHVLSTWFELEDTWGFWCDTCAPIDLINVFTIQLNNFKGIL